MNRKILVIFGRVGKLTDIISGKLRNNNIVRWRLITSKNAKDVLFVGKDKEFKTISSAVKMANDTPSFPVTIKVSPGILIESVKIRGGRYITIVGEDKEKCILQNNSGNYWTPPLELGGNSNIFNMTVIATHDDGKDFVLPSFAIHQDYAGKGKSLISNCKLVSHQHSAIGIGLHNEQTVIIDNCDLYSTSSAAIFAHNRKKNDAINQKLIVKNSRIESLKGSPLLLHDSNHRTDGGFGDSKDTEFGFYDNVFKSGDLDESDFLKELEPPLSADCLVGYIKLTSDSHGNNIKKLNAKVELELIESSAV